MEVVRKDTTGSGVTTLGSTSHFSVLVDLQEEFVDLVHEIHALNNKIQSVEGPSSHFQWAREPQRPIHLMPKSRIK